MRVIFGMGIWLLVFAVAAIAAPVIGGGGTINSTIEILPMNGSFAEIIDVDIQQQGKDLLVSGTIAKTGRLFTSYTAHVDVAVVQPGGNKVKLGTAEYRAFPSRNRTSNFEVRIPDASAAGAEVRLAFHREDEAGRAHSRSLCMLQSKGSVADCS